MLKLTAIVSLVLIGSTMWAASLSCDSCGAECTAACGTRHFRSCCFNYLRKKRGPDAIKFLSPDQDMNTKQNDLKTPSDEMKTIRRKLPAFVVDNIPEQWMSSVIASKYRPYAYEDTIENRLFDDNNGLSNEVFF